MCSGAVFLIKTLQGSEVTAFAEDFRVSSPAMQHPLVRPGTFRRKGDRPSEGGLFGAGGGRQLEALGLRKLADGTNSIHFPHRGLKFLKGKEKPGGRAAKKAPLFFLKVGGSGERIRWIGEPVATGSGQDTRPGNGFVFPPQCCLYECYLTLGLHSPWFVGSLCIVRLSSQRGAPTPK